MASELAESQKMAWVGLLLAHSTATRAIDGVLRAEGFPSLEVYDVLLALEDAPDRRMRMVDLAEAVVFSPSGLTRLIDRMESSGFVHRMACPGDRRVVHIALTPKGRKAREETWPRYSELIHEHFARYMSLDEAKPIAAGLLKVSGGERLRKRCPDN